MKLQVIKHNFRKIAAPLFYHYYYYLLDRYVFLSNLLTLEIFAGLHANGDRSKMKNKQTDTLHDCNTSIINNSNILLDFRHFIFWYPYS